MPGRQGPQPQKGRHISAVFPLLSPSASFMVLVVPFMSKHDRSNPRTRRVVTELWFCVLSARCPRTATVSSVESEEPYQHADPCLREECRPHSSYQGPVCHSHHRFRRSFFLKPRLRQQSILWKVLFNKKRIKLSILNKVDHCETWVKSHGEGYVRLTHYVTRPPFNSWYGSFCCSKGKVAKAEARAHDII